MRALAAQTVTGFRVLVSDDGSGPATAALLDKLHSHLPYDLQHVWQEDKGFRAGAVRNRALAQVDGGYVIFLDGDSVPRRDFIAKHCALAETGWFVAGNRVLLSHAYTGQLLSGAIRQTMPLWRCSILGFKAGQINRRLPLLSLPLGVMRKLQPKRWQGAKTCNLGVWHADAERINGFDEDYQGWGHEDADFVCRLIRSGVYRKEGRFAVPVLHLWHKEQDRSCEAANRERLQQVLEATHVVAQTGMAQYQ